MMKKYLIVLVSFISLTAQAKNQLCIYANGPGLDPFGGHAFVTVEQGSEVIDTYGYYPEVVPSYSAKAYMRNYNQILSDVRLYDLHGKFAIQARFCRPISKELSDYSLRWYAKEYASAYLAKYPTYNAINRNCGTFAKLAYSQITGDKIPNRVTPVGIAKLIEKAQASGAKKLSEVK